MVPSHMCRVVLKAGISTIMLKHNNNYNPSLLMKVMESGLQQVGGLSGANKVVAIILVLYVSSATLCSGNQCFTNRVTGSVGIRNLPLSQSL